MSIRPQQVGPVEVPVVTGAIAGALSVVTGYLVTLVVVAIAESENIFDDLLASAGWVYYNAQFVNAELVIERDEDAGVLEDFFDELAEYAFEHEFNLVTGDGPTAELVDLAVPALVYHLIPVVAFLVAGFVVARRVGAVDGVQGAVAGASLVFGAVVVALLGTFLFTVSDNGASISPLFLEGVVLAGIAYPGMLGALGGFLSTQV